MYLFDSLCLPLGLFPGDEGGPVEFSTLAECMHYCERFVQETLGEQLGNAEERATLAQGM